MDGGPRIRGDLSFRAKPQLVERRASDAGRCRCGTWIPQGFPSLEIVGAPFELTDWVRGRRFCQTACVRAYLSEAIEYAESRPACANTANGLRWVLRSLLS